VAALGVTPLDGEETRALQARLEAAARGCRGSEALSEQADALLQEAVHAVQSEALLTGKLFDAVIRSSLTWCVWCTYRWACCVGQRTDTGVTRGSFVAIDLRRQ
jgi:hypothetical protein